MVTKKDTDLAFFDTSAFIPLYDDQNPCKARILQHFAKRKPLFAIDTVVLSEFLVVPAPEGAEAFLKSCRKQFQIHSFDVLASRICSELFKLLLEKGQVPKPKTERQITKVDAMILSSAIAAGAGEFLFGDGAFSSWMHYLPGQFCGRPLPKFVCISTLPPVPIQPPLPFSPPPTN